MNNISYRDPTGDVIQNPTEEFLVGLVMAPPKAYWEQGRGGATLDFESAAGEEFSLLILPNSKLGYYLQFLRSENSRIVETWLSLSDPSRLKEVAECSDEWMASVGLFLPPVAAAAAIKEFARTGRRSDQVMWIQPDALPEEGNW